MVEKSTVYRSTVDLRMIAVKVAGLAIILIPAYLLLRVLLTTAELASGLMLLILVLLAFVTVPVRYIITSTELVVQAGLLKTRIDVKEILRVYPSRMMMADRALSPNQLAIEYREGPHARSAVHISPAQRGEFLRELAATADLEERDQQWVRPASGPPGNPLNRRTKS